MKHKKGLTREQLVKLIWALLIFGVLILFIIKFKGRDIIDKEACHQSVVMRSIPGISEVTKRSYPLRCKTEDIVINSVRENDIKKEIADRMYDCWWMLGEGKANFFLRPFGLSETHCLVCSNIKFGDNAKKLGAISGFSSYLANTKTPKGKTYFELFGVEREIKDEAEQPIDTSKNYVIIFSLAEKSHFLGTTGGAAGCAASALIGVKLGTVTSGAVAATIVGAPFAPGAGAIVGGATFVLGCGGSIWSAVFGLDKLMGKAYVPQIHLVAYNTENVVEEIGCDSIESIP